MTDINERNSPDSPSKFGAFSVKEKKKRSLSDKPKSGSIFFSSRQNAEITKPTEESDVEISAMDLLERQLQDRYEVRTRCGI